MLFGRLSMKKVLFLLQCVEKHSNSTSNIADGGQSYFWMTEKWKKIFSWETCLFFLLLTLDKVNTSFILWFLTHECEMVVSPGFNTPFSRFFSYFIVKIQKIQTELSLGVLTPIIVEIEPKKSIVLMKSTSWPNV